MRESAPPSLRSMPENLIGICLRSFWRPRIFRLTIDALRLVPPYPLFVTPGQHRFHQSAEFPELSQARRLSEVRKRGILFRLLVILWRIRGRHHDHRGLAITFCGPEALQDVRSIAFWQVHIQKNEIQPGSL